MTLVAVSSVAIQPTVRALEASMRDARFGAVLLLSDRPLPQGARAEIALVEIDRISSRADYSRFMLRDLAAHVDTSHVLCIQWDGYVIDGARWDPEFLEYDYIGAPWPHFAGGHDVGNGGFSLRSRRLLEACRMLPFNADEPEDIQICRTRRNELERTHGIRFAPAELARRFAYERCPARGDEFGFHGAFNLVELVPSGEALALIRSLEPELLAPNEHRELLRWALRHGYVRFAREIVRRLRRSGASLF